MKPCVYFTNRVDIVYEDVFVKDLLPGDVLAWESSASLVICIEYAKGHDGDKVDTFYVHTCLTNGIIASSLNYIGDRKLVRIMKRQ
jgi:hypothetical protein